jgi:tetratricopeptide (TPR) repeat protein
VVSAATAYAFAAIPARIALENQAWEEAMTVPTRWPDYLPWDRFPHLEAIPVYGQALGAARSGELESARASVDRLKSLEEAADALGDPYDWGAAVQVQILTVNAWIAHAEQEEGLAVELLTEAADMELSLGKHAVTPGVVLPARELLGDLLLTMGRHEEAVAAYTMSLETEPRRFNSLFGAGLASELNDDAGAAAAFYEQLIEMSVPGGAERDRLVHARQFVAEFSGG